MAFAFTIGDGSDSEEGIWDDDVDEPSSVDEGENQVSSEYFSADDIQDDIKDQYKKATKEPNPEDPIHKKIASFFIDNLKLHKMQLVGLHSDMKSIKERVDSTKSKQQSMFDDRLPALHDPNEEKGSRKNLNSQIELQKWKRG